MDEEKLEKILEKHKLWLRGDGGEKANLRRADRVESYLRGVDLSKAALREANLREAILIGVYLSGADL